MASDLRSELSSDTAATTSTTEDSASPSKAESAASEAQEVVEAAEPPPGAAERVDLNLVSDQTAAESGIGVGDGVDATLDSEVSEPAASEASERRGIPIWLVLLGLVIAALVVGYQMRLNGQLEAEVSGLQAELGRAEAVLGAHKTHLGDIRGGVRDLSAQLQSLQTLVDTEPVLARDVARDVARDESAPAQP